MEELQKLYDVLVREGKYTKSFDEFKVKWSQDEAYKNKVYDVVSRDGIYTKDKNSFFQKYSGGVSAEKPSAPVKKKFALESSSEVGSSEQPKPINPKTEEFQAQFKQAMDKQKSIPKDLSGKAIFDSQKVEETKNIFKNIEKEKKQLSSEKKKYGDMFDKQLNIKPNVEGNQYLKDRLSAINTDLINREEEYVVPELEYQFGDLGFKFEESGATGDFVKVTASNGKTTEISLDNFLDSKSKTQSEILQKFIKDNTPAKGLFVLEKTMREQDKKFNSQKQVDESIKGISTELNSLNAKQKQFLVKKSQFDKELKALGANPDKQALSALEQQRLALKAEMDILIKEEENIKQKSKKLDSAVGKYSIAKSKQGTWGGGIWNAINEGASSMAAGITNLTIDLTTEIAPAGFGMLEKDLKDVSVGIAKKLGIKGPNANQTIDQWKKTLTEDQLDNWEDEVDDYIKKDLKGNLLPAIRIGNREVFGDADTTKQWSNLKEQDFWGGAILGVAKSLPAMIGGAGPVGAAQRTAQMYAQVSDGLTQEMEQDPDFKDISENEKLAITLPIGIVGAVLENIGLKNIKGSQGVINRIALNALGKSGRGVTAKTFRELVENEVDGMLSKGLLTITAAGAAEFETGAAQELSDTAFKAVYNEIKGKEMFDTPESAADLIENIAVAGAQEAIGGFVLGVPTAVSTAFAEKGFLKMDDATFDTFANMANDENMQSAYIATLKDKITRGELTASDAKNQLNDYRNSVGLFRQLPDGIDTQGKKEAMNLLKEKRDLENYINEKDPALVVKQKNRIAEINDSLTKLSETNAIQEQSTTAIPVQSETGISETVAEGISEPKPEIITEQATQEEVKEPTIVVHGAVNGFGLQYSEGINAEDIVTPKDGRGFLPVEQQKDLNEYKSVIAEDTVSDDGNKLLTIITPSSDNFGRSATNTFEFIIPNGNTSTSEGIKAILDEVTKSDLKGKEVINESVNQVKEYINSNKPVTETQPEVNVDSVVQSLDSIDAKILEETLPLVLDIEGEQLMPSEQYSISDTSSIAQAYKIAKEDGSNPELVKAVESLLPATAPQTIIEEQVSSKTQPTTQIKTQNETGQQPTVQPERTGDRTGRTDSREITPLEGSPTIQGATGPDPQLVSVAEQYAADNGIDLKRQSEYVEVDEERAQRIAQAYEEMAHDPQNPKVKEAYAELIKQTIAQYQALVDAGYKFWFMDLDIPSNVEYAASPYNAMRDLRQNKQMGVFPTVEGFGTSELDVNDNPLLAETGFEWSVGGLDGPKMPVLANDLFRAVHDAFGHGLEGAGFRARGEENAWQAHIRLFTGPAKGAITSETRGQNSWLNYGPEGENNRTAKVEDTVFADQKTGLMPEWTWTEGLAGDTQAETEVAENLAEENVSQEINEQDLPGYDRMMGEVEGIVQKSKRRGVNEAKIADNVISYVMGSKVYENATDVQREALVRDIRKRFGLREKAAPSVARLFGKIKDVKKITMTEKVALKKQIKDLARGARDAVRAFKLASQQLSKDVKELKASGKITSDQAANVIRAFSKVNVFSAKSVDRFTTYMTKVFENADYSAKIKDAKGFRSSLKKLSKNKDKNANLRIAASQFTKIDPSLVEDIETYNEIASKLKEAITGSSVRGQKVRFAETTNIQEVTDYTSETLKEQEQKIREEMIVELQDLMGVDASEFSAEEMLALLEPEAKTNKYNEGIVRATIKRAFDVYSAMIKESISSGKDIFTDEDVEYTKAQKEIIKKFMSMDTDNMGVKDSLAAVDSLMNFLTNQSTAKMEAVLAKYTGQQNAARVAKQNIFALPLKKLGSKAFGRFLGEQTTNLNILFEKMFVGFNRAGKVKDAMGLTDLINGKSKAQRQANTIVANYVADFYNKKANNQKFNTLYNNVERGITSFMSRNVIGTEAEMQTEFDRRKKLIEESIDVLSVGNEQERKKALVYQKAYDKVLDGSTNIDEVQSKVDPVNLEAVDFWIKEWDSKFDELSDTALNVYNKVLDKDLNYTPDRFTRMSYDGGSVDLANTDSAFITNTNGNLYKKETGVLMEATRPDELPKNADSNEAESYIDLSFDKNNSNSMYDALVDINTAAPIRQIEAFMNTADFRKIFGEDADLIKGTKSSVGRIQQYIQNIRNKNPYSNDEFAKAMRTLNKIATLGVGQALAGPTQPFKQVIPVALNTLVNTGGSIDFSAMSNKDFMSWLNETGYAISNRGVESQADVDSINKMIDEAAESKGAKAVKLLEDANKRWLKMFLVKPDVWVAVSSWKSYYEQSLKDQGVDVKGIDYSTHEVNKEAADYAQRMVDRQQNISDTDMSGTMFSNKNPYAQTMVKIFMPFASFRMNQGSRLGSDLRVLSNWDISTPEDRKIAARSLAGYAVEMAVFRTISAGIGIGIASMTASLMGKGDDEEEKKKRREGLVKGAVTSVITDVLSPIPVLDRLVQSNSALIIEGVQKAFGVEDKDIKNIYESRKVNFVDALGTFGITAKRIDEIWDLVSLSATGTYKDDYGKTRQISDENKNALTKLVPVVLVSNLIGLASPEVSGVSRNAMKIAKKKSPTPEELQETEDKINSIQEIIDNATSPQDIEAAESMLDRIKNPENYENEKETLKEMKPSLLIDEETGVKYENQTDLKRYNRELWEKNFGEGSEWYELNKSKKEAEKLFRDKEREAKDKEFGYAPKKRRKNSDGTYKSSSSRSRRGFSNSGSSSSSSGSSTGYDSNGLKTTTTRSSSRRGFNN